jgi:hypothetical protein
LKVVAEPLLRLAWRPFQFHLPQAMVTAHGALAQRCGWLLRLEAADGRLGWGEALPLEPEQGALASGLAGELAGCERPAVMAVWLSCDCQAGSLADQPSSHLRA